MKKTMEQINTEHRRLSILRTLAASPGYAANDSILHTALRQFALLASRDQVRGDIEWLTQQGLVTSETLATAVCTVATLTQAGQDVVDGVINYPGVARPAARG